MRLFNTTTFQLSEFIREETPEYVILSHCWGMEEVTLQDIELGKAPKKKEGWWKLTLRCRQAAQHGFPWIWVETCCIDKTSPTQLSEIRNSMYEWYQKSCRCYAYLIDCDSRQDFHE
ncbi:HET domain-containing protein [Paraphaeosphaeria minitans]|uniref:HET domain-containing protein n=1 Tax=Paraphaeosphaeria minitans TaxID=565426 RepID=A0A9P6G5X3_9PLEO|nr:HET domain-containing protein [Paraphaeosphaeria minitans]